MDASNEILFNSPALHSLKRQQLLILCKKYGIKQSGKNEDLVFKLREYAKGLLDPAQHSAIDSTQGADAPEGTHTRSSQQWELVEGDQSHEEENSVLEEKRSRTLSMKSLGALSSKSGSSMGNSLMSIAHSLTRAGSKSSKSSQSRPNSMLLSVAGSIRLGADANASVRTTSSSMSTTASQSFVKTPLSHLFPAVPSTLPQPNTHTNAPPSLETKDETNSVADETHVPEDLTVEESADLNRPILQSCIDGSTLGNETTVRLVTRPAYNGRQDIEFGGQTNISRKRAFETPKLRPFHVNLAPNEVPPLPQPKPLPTPLEDIGHAFLDMDGRSFTETVKSVATATTVLPESIYGGTGNEFGTIPTVSVDDCTTTPTKVSSMASHSTGLTAPSGPFIFGSPAHTVSNAQFGQAAAAILDEMNKRLGIDSSSSGAAKIGEDGTLNFGEVTPHQRASLIGRGRTNEGGRFGRAHDKEFERMESIADYHSTRQQRAQSPVKPATSLAGTKRKSTAAFAGDEQGRSFVIGKRIINLDDPKEKFTRPPAPKRQKVDGADLAEMEKANVKRTESSSTVEKADNVEAKKKTAATKERRRSSKGRRSSAVGTNGRRKSVAQAKAAPTSRMGLLRGAAKVMKNIISSVSHPTPVPAATTKTSASSKALAAPAKETKPVQKPLAPPPAPSGTSSLAPKTKKPSLPGVQTTRPAVVPRGSSTATSSSRAPSAFGNASASSRAPSALGNASTSSRAPSAMSNRTGASSLAPKPAGAQKVVRPLAATSTRGKIPDFGEVDLGAVPGLKNLRTPSGSSGVTAMTGSGSSRRSSNMSISTSTSTSLVKRGAASRSTSGSSLTAPTIASQARMAKNAAPAPTASVSLKATLESVPESQKKKAVEKDPDFEPSHRDAYDGLEESQDGLRPDSPLPEPPASLSSRPLAKRNPLEPTQAENGSLGRKPRISRSKVIAKVHASREETKKPTTAASAPKGRKSVGVTLSAKAKMMGGDGGAREKRVSAAADAAKRKARMSEAAARRRTMAKV